MQLPTAKDLSSIESLVWFITSMIGFVLLVVTYTYIRKLESVDCACAEHPHKDYIKKYLMFAIGWLLVTSVLSPAKAVSLFGPVFGIIYKFLHWVYVIATVVFFIYSIKYVNYLMREKCKCSEDVRRSVLYWWSILMIVIYVSLVLIPLLVVFVSGGVALAISSGKGGLRTLDTVATESAMNPLKSARKVPKALRQSLKTVLRKK